MAVRVGPLEHRKQKLVMWLPCRSSQQKLGEARCVGLRLTCVPGPDQVEWRSAVEVSYRIAHRT